MKRILTFVLILVLIFALTACGTEKTTQETGDTYTIKTSIGKIHYPAEWKDQIRTERTKNRIAFYANMEGKPEQLLFTLEFGESQGYLLGKLNGTDVYVVEGELNFDDTWTDEEKNMIRSMQDAVNTIIDTDLEPAPIEPSETDTFAVNSAIGELQYPKKWQNNVRAEATDNSISFFGTVEGKPEQLLFTLEFGDSQGYKLCSLNGTDISIIEGKLSFDDTWTAAERSELICMQDAVNTILEGLEKMDGYAPA